jgi:hypothetical protein
MSNTKLKINTPKPKDSSKNINDENKSISKTQFINLLLSDLKYDIKLGNSLLTKELSTYKINYFPKLFNRTYYLSKTLYKYKKSFDSHHILNMFLYSILFLIEQNKKLKSQMDFLKEHYLLMLNKFYKEKIIDFSNLLLIIKFITYLSIYDRKDFTSNKFPKFKLIRNYSIFKFSINIIKRINKIDVTKEYIDFLNENIIKYKPNLFIVTQKTDMLELINLNDQKDYIIEFLAKLYSFKYSKSFLDVFIFNSIFI